MSASVEQIYAALYARALNITWTPAITGATTWRFKDRRVKLFSDIPAEQKPALCQAEHDADYTQKSGLPYKRIFEAQWVIYTAVPDVDGYIPTTDINILLQACQDALAPNPGDMGWPQRNTLGGLVYHCFIEGRILKDPGDIDNQGMMIVPIKILAP